MKYLFLICLCSFVFAQNRAKLDIETKKTVIEALKANESLHQSFFKYNGENIDKNTKLVISKIELIKDKKISKKLKLAKTYLKAISKAKTQKDNYGFYSRFSELITSVVKSYDLGKEYNVYYCSMLKMSWVQNAVKLKKVHNPYASYMPHCGEHRTRYDEN